MNEPSLTSDSIDALKTSLIDQRIVAADEARQWAQESDVLTGKIRYGLVLLNGASIIATLSLSGGAGELSKALGFSPAVLLFSITSFIIGILAGGICLMSHQNELVIKSGFSKARASNLHTALSILRGQTAP